MRSDKGAIVITETMLTIGAILVGIILLVITFSTIFSSQARSVEDVALISMAASLENYIERVAASSGSVSAVYAFPSGVSMNVNISNNEIELSYANASIARRIKTDFASQLNTDKVYSFYTPEKLCIVKNGYDNKILILEGRCECNTNDNICDPACVADNNCDPSCYKASPDEVCDLRCVKHGDGICDPDCTLQGRCDSDCKGIIENC